MAYGQMLVHRACFCTVMSQYEDFQSERSERTGGNAPIQAIEGPVC